MTENNPLPVGRKRSARLRKRLTVELVEALKPKRTEYTCWDEDERRFGVRVLPSGGRTYILRVLVPTGAVGKSGKPKLKQKSIKLGKHGDPWTPEAARIKAKRILLAQVEGTDISNERSREKTVEAPPTVEEFGQQFLLTYGAAHLKASSLKAYRLNFKNHVVPALGRLRVDEVTREDVEELHFRIGSKNGKPYAANRVRALLHRIFQEAEAKEIRPQRSNPARGGSAGIKSFKETARRRYLSADEWAKLGQAIAELEGKESPWVLAGFKLLCYTGCRCSEIFRLKWSEVDLDRGVLELTDSKSGPKTTPLGTAATTILADLPKVAGNDHVIPGWRTGRAFTGEGKVWERIRARAGLEGVRIHDLRHSFASVAVSDGAGLPLLGSVLGHSQPATTQRYSHIAQDPALALSEQTSSKIAGMLTPATPATKGSNVRPFRRKRS